MLFADEQTSFPYNLKQLANTHHHNNNSNNSNFVDDTSTPTANHSTAAVLYRRTEVLRKSQATQIDTTKAKTAKFTKNEVSELLFAISVNVKIAHKTSSNTSDCRQRHCNTYKQQSSNNNKNYIPHNNNINDKKSSKTDQPDHFMGLRSLVAATECQPVTSTASITTILSLLGNDAGISFAALDFLFIR
ncbi:putative uncharacterized protein DDB_G0285031 [Zeugodacus cucurbitae]|uniref:putative uncharacterized protein DDB_G0285031 n=1 Tax=Zeugodacus cucurbitae TaxID=28588 RepID=UPI0023D8E64F|nr:putative uncharacterized protein DDB_G0285031 [Zeugodacus cucurbitae]